MLEWMQKHKKYLVITVWISAFALVFASLVEWGGGGFTAGSNEHIAKVGNQYISRQEYDRLYNILYNQLFQNQEIFSNENERIPQIEQQVYMWLVQTKMSESLADDIGVSVTPNELAHRIITNPNFFDSQNQFNKDIYDRFIVSTGRTTESFEEQFSKNILEEKIQNFPIFQLSTLEIDSLLSANKIRDNLLIRVINKDTLLKNKTIELQENEIKSFWEKNKEKYYKPANYKIAYIALNTDDIEVDDNSLQKYYNENIQHYSENALQTERDLILEDYKKSYTKITSSYMRNMSKFLNSKDKYFGDVIVTLDRDSLMKIKDVLETDKEMPSDFITINYMNLSDDDLMLYPNLLAQIEQEDKSFSPVFEEKSKTWIIPYVLDRSPRSRLSYEDAKPQARDAVWKQKEYEEFRKIAQSSFVNANINSFQDIGFISIADMNMQSFQNESYSILKNLGLEDFEIRSLFSQIISNNQVSGVAFLDSKAVFYSIKNQELPTYGELLNISNGEDDQIAEAKIRDMRNALFEYTTNKYKIIDYRRQN